MILEPNTERCANENVGPSRGRIVRSHIVGEGNETFVINIPSIRVRIGSSKRVDFEIPRICFHTCFRRFQQSKFVNEEELKTNLILLVRLI